MKILYAAGKLSGANLRAAEFIKHTDADVRVLAYAENHEHLHHIDWLLDPLYSKNPRQQYIVYEILGCENAPFLDHENLALLLDDLVIWGPELVISDWDQLSCYLAKALEIPLWICSPANMLHGIDWERKQLSTNSFIRHEQGLSWPEADRKLIYSPFCDISARPFLKEGYEWVKPYSINGDCTRDGIGIKFLKSKLKNDCILAGETEYLSAAFYKNQKLIIVPRRDDIEGLLNGILVDWYKIGFNFWDSAEILDLVQRDYQKASDLIINNYLSQQNWGYLHEKI